MKIKTLEQKECSNGSLKSTVQFSDGDHVDENVGFFGDFPFKVGDNITATIKKSKDGRYLNGYDPTIAKVASPDPLEGQAINGVQAPAKAITHAFNGDLLAEGILQQLQVMNDHFAKFELIFTEMEKGLRELKELKK